MSVIALTAGVLGCIASFALGAGTIRFAYRDDAKEEGVCPICLGPTDDHGRSERPTNTSTASAGGSR
jgi:hypothetical protein